MSKRAISALFFLLVVQILSQNPLDTSKCDEAKTCEKCMGISPECSWCFDENFDDTRAENGPGFRCALNTTLIDRGCPSNKIQYVSSLESKEAQVNTENQLQPVVRSLKVRPKETFSTSFKFKSRENYPVDLYFLVDLSFTMKKHLKTVSDMTKNIKDEMLKITNDLRMGFGAFVDKPILPFVNPSKINDPCYGDPGYNAEKDKCEPTFLYRHMLKLTNKSEEFQEITQNMIHSGNLDTPEGGFDALLQVAHCTDLIGWRKDARKIVVFATDGSFHLAGDGRLAGLVNPPPTTCKLTQETSRHNPGKTFYSFLEGNLTDYPSIGEVARVLTESSISVIFATVKDLEYIYNSAAEFLPSAKVGILESDSRNIVDLLRDNYNKIASQIDIQVSENSLVDVKLRTKCKNETQFTEKKLCQGHPVGGEIEYEVSVTPKRCFPGVERVTLKVTGLEETAYIDVESQCQCPLCDTEQGSSWALSSRCSNQGRLECGSCKCNRGFTGDFCKCSDQVDEKQLESRCRQTDSSPICSRRGRCNCGQCICNKDRYSGQFCECDLEMCPRANDNNQVCGGKERGKCQCDGTCSCEPEYKVGGACDCLLSSDGCINRDSPNATWCSGNGICDCGSCFCHPGWTGRLCSEPQGDGSVTCDQMQGVKQCIPCLLEHHLETEKGMKSLPNEVPVHQKAKDKCRDACSGSDLDYENAMVVASQEDQNDGSNLCIHYTEDCKIYFLYRFSDVIVKSTERKVTVKLIRNKECPDPKSTIYIVVGVVSAIVLGGLLFLLIWKLVIVIEDTKEYAKYESANKHSQWAMTMNPTYANPSTTVQNPIYQK